MGIQLCYFDFYQKIKREKTLLFWCIGSSTLSCYVLNYCILYLPTYVFTAYLMISFITSGKKTKVAEKLILGGVVNFILFLFVIGKFHWKKRRYKHLLGECLILCLDCSAGLVYLLSRDHLFWHNSESVSWDKVNGVHYCWFLTSGHQTLPPPSIISNFMSPVWLACITENIFYNSIVQISISYLQFYTITMNDWPVSYLLPRVFLTMSKTL